MRLVGPLVYALQKYPEQVSGYSLGQMMPNTDFVARQNDKRPATMQLFVPDDWVKNIAGDKTNLQDVYIMLRIDRAVVEEFDRESVPVSVEPEKGLYLP